MKMTDARVNVRIHGCTATSLPGNFQPACWRQNKVHTNIVPLRRNFPNDLLVEGDPAFGPGNLGEQAIIESPAPAQPVSGHIKS